MRVRILRCLADGYSSFASRIWKPLLFQCSVFAAALAQIVLF
jgi:hypothetical protein